MQHSFSYITLTRLLHFHTLRHSVMNSFNKHLLSACYVLRMALSTETQQWAGQTQFPKRLQNPGQRNTVNKELELCRVLRQYNVKCFQTYSKTHAGLEGVSGATAWFSEEMRPEGWVWVNPVKMSSVGKSKTLPRQREKHMQRPWGIEGFVLFKKLEEV